MQISEKEWQKIVDTCPEVRVASLHQSVQAIGAMNAEKTLSAQKVKGIRMFSKSDGLYFEVRGVRGRIPAANVAIEVFMKADEDLAKTKSA